MDVIITTLMVLGAARVAMARTVRLCARVMEQSGLGERMWELTEEA